MPGRKLSHISLVINTASECVSPFGRRLVIASSLLLLAGLAVQATAMAGTLLPKGPLIATVYCPNNANVGCRRVFGQGRCGTPTRQLESAQPA
jgi:hypothetical protein